MKPFKAIAAMGLNRAIGKSNTLPWNIPEELQWFKKMTIDQVILMGRKTYDSIGRPLPRRETIVLSRSSKKIEGIRVIHTLEELSQNLPVFEKDIWIVGGAEIYNLTLPYCSDLYLTQVKKDIPDADVFFPKFEDSFKLVEVIKDTPEFTIYHYKNPKPALLHQDHSAKNALINTKH